MWKCLADEMGKGWLVSVVRRERQGSQKVRGMTSRKGVNRWREKREEGGGQNRQRWKRWFLESLAVGWKGILVEGLPGVSMKERGEVGKGVY